MILDRKVKVDAVYPSFLEVSEKINCGCHVSKLKSVGKQSPLINLPEYQHFRATVNYLLSSRSQFVQVTLRSVFKQFGGAIFHWSFITFI